MTVGKQKRRENVDTLANSNVVLLATQRVSDCHKTQPRDTTNTTIPI